MCFVIKDVNGTHVIKVFATLNNPIHTHLVLENFIRQRKKNSSTNEIQSNNAHK